MLLKSFLRTGGGLALIAFPSAVYASMAEEPLWGETHIHTSYSFDAYTIGNTTIDPDAAYRFARGLPVLHPQTRNWVRLDRPLDFMAVTDHAELLAIPQALNRNDPHLTRTPLGARIAGLLQGGDFKKAFQIIYQAFISPDSEARASLANESVQAASWAEEVQAADRNNRPGEFTALVGWEWTSMPNGNNLHRVIITDAGGSDAASIRPFTALDSERPQDLWHFLEASSRGSAFNYVAIPHNSNVSGGLMFSELAEEGKLIGPEMAALRAKWETVAEITQTKGTSETHPLLSPTDEFAAFEFYPSMLTANRPPTVTNADYLRGALKSGMQIEQKIGINPFKLGFVGGTDIHTGLSSAEESAFLGKTASSALPENGPEVRRGTAALNWDISSSGRTAVWADANTRQSILQAFRRREVYATTGPRITLRFFAGYGYKPADADSKRLAETGYSRGVPMGADLIGGRGSQHPSFLIRATKDPAEANLDRIQVVKLWVDHAGEPREKVFDVAWSGKRKRGPDGKVPAVGNTVDLASARYTNTIGAVELSVVWKDPEFDPDVRAAYYVRVLQIPTPRYSLYSAIAMGVPVQSTRQPATIQERAFSSPIWYYPNKPGRTS